MTGSCGCSTGVSAGTGAFARRRGRGCGSNRGTVFVGGGGRTDCAFGNNEKEPACGGGGGNCCEAMMSVRGTASGFAVVQILAWPGTDLQCDVPSILSNSKKMGREMGFYLEDKNRRIKGPRSALDNGSSRGTTNVKNNPRGYSPAATPTPSSAILHAILACSCRSRRLSAQVLEAWRPTTLIGWTRPGGAILGGGEGVGAGRCDQSESDWEPQEADQRRAEGRDGDED